MPRGRAAILISAVALAVAMTAGGCGAHQKHGEQAPASSSGAPSYAEYLRVVKSADYDVYKRQPGAKVRNRAAFEDMRDYLLGRFGAADVTTSYRDGAAVIDCVKASKSSASASPPSPATPPGSSDGGSASGATASGGCPSGSVPVRRILLEDLVKFKTLADFNSKHP